MRPLLAFLVTLAFVSIPAGVEARPSEVVGVPIVTDIGTRSLVTWQSGTTAPVVMAVVVDDDGVSLPMAILEGRLLGVHRLGDVVHVVAFNTVRLTLEVGTIPSYHMPNPLPIPLRWDPNPLPIPAGRIGSIPSRWDPNPNPIPALWDPNPLPIPAGRVALLRTFGAAPLELTPPPEFITHPDTWLPCVDATDDRVVIAWQAGRNVIGRVVLTEDGVEGAGEFFRGPNGSCQAVLNVAQRY